MSVFDVIQHPSYYRFNGDFTTKSIDSANSQVGPDFNPYQHIDVKNYRMNKKGRAAYQQDLAELLYLAQIQQENRMNEYNSPIAQSQRMREAGLNPDVSGVEGVPAQNVAGYQGNALDGIDTNSRSFGNIVSIIGNVASLASGLISGIQGINAASLQNLGSALGNSTSMMQLFDSLPQGQTMKDFISSLPGLSNSMKKRVYKFYGQYFNSPSHKTGTNNTFKSLFDSIGEYNKSFYNPYNQNIKTLTQDEWAKIWKPFIEASVKDVEDRLQNSDKLKTEADILKYQKESFETFKKPLIEVMDNLDGYGDIGLYIKAALSAVLLNGLAL